MCQHMSADIYKVEINTSLNQTQLNHTNYFLEGGNWSLNIYTYQLTGGADDWTNWQN